MVRTGMGEVVLPEIGGMQMAIDEHHRQHKDAYHHSLTVLRQAIELEEPGERDLVLRWALSCTTSASRPPVATRPTAG